MLTKRGHSSFKKPYRPFPWLEPHFACSIGKCCVDATPCPVKLRCLARIRSISFCNAWPDNLGQGCVFEFRQLPDLGNHVERNADPSERLFCAHLKFSLTL